MKLWFSAKELAGIGGLSKHPSNVNRLARKEKWQSQPLKGVKGGGVEYALSSLPELVQMELQKKFVCSVSKPKSLPADLRQVELKTLTEKQREVAGARMALVAQVAQLEQAQPRYKAIKFFCEQIKRGGISSDLMRLVETANNKKGKNRTLSDRTLNQWVLDYEKADTPEERLKALAPMQRVAKKAEEIVWLPDFLAIYRQTNGINVAEAYHYFSAEWDARFADEPLRLEMKPSIDQVRAALAKLPKHIKEIGRKTGSELRALNTYVKRDWSVLQVNDVWVGDGHAMKLKVAHPEHGRPFIPEVTLIMDAACRFIVGWSASLAENVLAVADALRYASDGHASFDSEYQNDPVSGDDAIFANSLQYWTELPNNLIYFGAVDPSLGKAGASRDPSAILVGGYHRETGKLYVVEAQIKKRLPDLIIEDVIRLHTQYNCHRWFAETVQFQEFLKTELVKRSAARGKPVPATATKPNSDKMLRIESLQPHIANGLILLHRSQSTLESQLRHFPKADHDDGPDALEMLWRNAVGSSAAIEWIGLNQLNEIESDEYEDEDDLYSIWKH